jgi:hypothetical protein
VGKSNSLSVRRTYAAVHRFVEHFDAEIEDAVHAARARRLSAIRSIEVAARCLYARCLPADRATLPMKRQELAIEPELALAIKTLDAATLAACVSELHNAIVALEPYDGVPFKRKPIGSHKAADNRKSADPEETALAALEQAGQNLVGVFHDLAERLAVSSTTTDKQRKKSTAKPSGMLTPPKVATRLGVSADKVRAWIRKGELCATNVAMEGSGRPRFGISEEDLAAFQARRQPAKPPPKPPRRRKKDPHVIEYFK